VEIWPNEVCDRCIVKYLTSTLIGTPGLSIIPP